jgi:ATP-dependent protease Clp ATPase subunit
MTALRCSFCNRTAGEVERIVSGPNPARPVHICNDCVRVCVGILRDCTGQDDAYKRFKLTEMIRMTHRIVALLGT